MVMVVTSPLTSVRTLVDNATPSYVFGAASVEGALRRISLGLRGAQSHESAARGHSPPVAWGTEVRCGGSRARPAGRMDGSCGWIHHDSRPRFAVDPPAADNAETLPGTTSAQGRLDFSSGSPRAGRE